MTDAIGPEDLPIGAVESPEYEPKSKPDLGCFLLTLAFCVAVLAAILVPNFLKAKARGQLTACKSNCKNIATALEMYAGDNAGHYPSNLEKLTQTPKGQRSPYLSRIPTCPSAGKMSYEDYQVSHQPDAFSFRCCGNNHGKAYTGFRVDSSGYPAYHSQEGLLDHP